MNGEILNNIWSKLSEDNLVDVDFDTWQKNFVKDPEVVGNVYSYLTQKNLVTAKPDEWIKNINEELAAQQPEQVIEQGGYEYKFEFGEDDKPIYYTKKKGNENWAVVDPKLNEENFITNPAYISIGQEFGHFEDDVFDREAYFKQQKEDKKETPEQIARTDAMGAFYESDLPSSVKKGMTIVNVIKALPQIATDSEERKQLSTYLKNRLDNVPEAFMTAYYSAVAAGADLFTADLDNFGYNEKQKEARDIAEKIIVEQYDKLDKLEFKDTGKGIVAGAKEGDAASLIAGVFGAGVSMAETAIPAALTFGASLPIQVAAPMYTEYNKAKAKQLYGDDTDAIQKLVENDQTEIAVPLALGTVATGLEYIGLKGVTRYIQSVPGKGAQLAKLLWTGSGEGFTEVGQLGVEKLNKSLGSGKSIEEASKDSWNAMTSDEGLEMWLNGFLGAGQMSVAGRAVNRALRNDNASVKDLNSKINNLANLNNIKYNTRNQEVKDVVDLEIKEAEQDLKNYITEKRKISEVLNEGQKQSLINIINEKDNIKSKVESLRTQLQDGKISNKEFGYAIRSLNNQDKKLTEQIELINATAKEQLLQTSLETTQEEAGKLGLEQIELSQEEFTKQFPDDADSDGAISDGKIYINRDVARETGAIGVGSHELLHGIIGNSYNKLETEEKIKLNKEFLNLLGSKEKAAILTRLASSYGITGDKVFETEELFTAFSDEIVDGGLSFNEGVFGKIKNTVHKVLNKLGYRREFENARQTYNFLKDYSKNIKQGKLTERAAEFAKEDPGVEGTRMSKSASDNVQRIYEDQGVGGALDIIDQFKPITNKIVERRRQAPGFDKQLLTDEIETGKRGILDLIQEYDPESGVPLAAYINKFLPSRAIEASRRVLGEEFTEDVTEARGVTAEDVTVETKQEPKKTKTRKLKELSDLNLENKDIISNNTFKKIQNIIELNPENIEEQINNLIKKDVAKEIKKEMGKISKKGKDVVISPEYDSFLSLGFDGIVNSLDVNTIKKKYGKLFKIKKKAREKDKKVDPLTGKVTYPGKGIYDITMPKKAEFIKYFTQGGYTTLLERQKVLSELIADSYTKKASQKYIAENAKDIDTAIKAEVERWIDSREKQKDENKSFDNVLFSKSLRNLSREEEIAFWNGLGEVSTIMNPALKNLLDSKVVKDILKQTYGDQIRDKNLTAIAKDIVKLLEKYQPAISKNKTIDETTWSEFVANSFMEEANNVIKVLNLEIDGKPVKSAASLYDNIKNIEQGRRVFVDIGNTLLKKYGPKKAARQIAILKGMYANNAKVGRGMFKTDMKTLKVVPVKLKKGQEFGSPRNQIFESVPVFNAYVNKIEGKNEAETKAFQEAYKNVKPLYNQDSKSAVKDKDYKGRLKEAQEAREIIDDVMSMLDNDLDIAMFMISNLSSMKTPLRRAANLRYIADAVLDMDVSKLGKLAEYEHMIPANYMALKIIDAYKNKGGIKNLDDFYKNYNVAIIPKTMDNVLKQQGLQSKMLAGYDFENDASWTRYYNILTNGFEGIVDIRDISSNEVIGPKVSFSKSFRAADTFDKAVDNARTVSEPRGITVLDFDDTLATTESLVKYTTPEGKTGSLNAEQYASTYEDLLDKGYTFDFSDFNKVVKGKLAPLFNKAIKLQGKFGPKNMFVLTARPPAAQKPIFDFLKANGLNIPLENITGLGNSTAEAKALWIADKVADGYNDFYFADDALQNVQAVKNMLDQFDVKSKVQQAKVKFSKNAGKEFNNILEQTKGLPSDYMISQAKARQRGKRKGLFQFFVPPSADDFAGLLQMFQGKGKQGMEHAAWFKKNLLDPFARGDRSLNGARQRTAEEFKALRKKFPKVSKKLRKVIPTGDYTFGDAVRVYLWDKNDIEVPGLTKTDQNNMLKLVKADPELQAFADVLGVISRKEDGYIAPDEYWMTKDIVADITEDGVLGDGRKDHLAEWIENKDLIFTPENLNKIEFLYGSNFREALEDILYRMENGTSRPAGSNRIVNNFLNWMNGGISVVMNWNTRSAVLQTLSTVNFINWGDNNILAAGKAFANQKQYWKDFAFLFNSDMLKQRRAGLKTSIESRELMSEVEGAVNPVRAAIRYLLRIGFTPTKFADSFAIASGGASFYRNRINTYKKQGYSQAEAEAKAFLDFQETAEEGQQSSRPDRLSQQQTSVLGRLILAFQNTPMQYVRMSKKEILDLVNGRFTGFTGPNSFASKTGKIMYYTAVQNLIFYSMQTALFAAMFSDEEDDEEFFNKKTERIFDNMADGVLRGMGVGGAVISTLKNIILKYIANKDTKMYDESAILMEGLKLSPPLSIKARQLLSADKTMRYNRDVIKQMETFDIDNPMWNAAFNVVEMTTNAPLSRMESKYKNVRNALDNRYETWQRVAFMLGYNTWSLGVKNEEIEAIKKEIKAIKTYERKKKAQEEKQAKQAEKQALINKDIEKEKKLQEEGKLKDPKCRHVNTKGERCSVSVANAGDLCTIHEEVLQRTDGKKTRCKQVKADGKRCGMQTSNKSGYCYYHD